MHPALDAALTRLPGVYARLAALRGQPNREKIAFLALVLPGDVMLDVGANEGGYTVLFSHLAGARGRVHAFEPVPPTFARLESRVARLRRHDNVVLNRCAVAETAGEVSLLVPGADLGQASLKPHAAGSWRDAAAIASWASRAITLDDYTAELPALDFIKCDVEGAELPVLRGAGATLRRFAPLLFLEVCADWTAGFGYAPREIVPFLAPFGYRSFFLIAAAPRPLADPERELAALRGSANLLCAVPERHAGRLNRLRRWLPGEQKGRSGA